MAERKMIYLDDAIDALKEIDLYKNNTVGQLGVLKSILAIELLPSAQPEQECDECVFKPFKQFQPERKKGEWIWNDEMKCFLCSECERGWREQPTLNGKPLFEWCPVCGADMRGDEKCE